MLKAKISTIGIAVAVIASFFGALFITPGSALADQQACEASGGKWEVAYDGSQLRGKCTTCPSGKSVSTDGQMCIATTNVGKTECENSGGTWEVAYDGSQLRGRCTSCPSGKRLSSSGLLCVGTSSSGGTTANTEVGPTDLTMGEEGDKMYGYLQSAVNLLTALAGLAITGSVIVAGIQYSTSGGNPQAAAQAKGRIVNALIALLALIFMFAFFQWLVPGGILS